jgi:hypothetical protein
VGGPGREGGVGRRSAGGDEVLSLTPLAVGDDRRPLEGLPRDGGFLPGPGIRMRPGTVVLGLGDRPPRGGGRGHRCRLDRRLARRGEELPRPLEPVGESIAVAACAGQRRQLGLGAEVLGAEPDPQERGLLGWQAPQAIADGALSVVPASFPEGELDAGDVEVGQAALVVVDGFQRASRSARNPSMCARLASAGRTPRPARNASRSRTASM